jgi:hypothetical protein
VAAFDRAAYTSANAIVAANLNTDPSVGFIASGSNTFFGSAMFINGISTQTTPMNGQSYVATTFSSYAGGVSIGQDRSFTSREWNGPIQEVILFSTNLSTAARQLIERNQGAYYGITVA